MVASPNKAYGMLAMMQYHIENTKISVFEDGSKGN